MRALLAPSLIGFLTLVGCGDSAPLSPDSELQTVDVFGTPSTSGDARTQETAAPPFRRILCFGDSITFGVTSRALLDQARASLTTVEGYVPKLARLLAAEFGEGIDLVNSGVGGETTSEGVVRLDNEIRLVEPDLILLLEGVTDVNGDNPRFPLVRMNLGEMMHIAQARRVPLIIGTYPLLNPEGFRINGRLNVPTLNDIIRQEAKARGVPIADHEIAFGDDFRGQGPDGLHPNDIGYEIMALTWFEQIVELAAVLSGET